MSDCRAVRDDMEIATVEPGGLDRLVAGDTPEAAAVAGHLAACPPCAEELARLHAADQVLRPILETIAGADLRDRVLAQVHSMGRAPAESAPSAPTDPASPSAPATARRRTIQFAWPAAAAAVLVLGLFGGALLGRSMAPAPTDAGGTALAAVARDAQAIMAAPDAEMVVLRTADGSAAGSLMAAHSAGKMLVLANDLPSPPAGRSYKCWAEMNGKRTMLGGMWVTSGVWWWSGTASVPEDPDGSMTFGVSLASSDGTAPDPSVQPVLIGN